MNDSGEKHFEPTPARLAKARREGNVARSAELSASVALGAALAAVGAIVIPFSGAARTALIAAAAGRVPWGACVALLEYALVPLAAAALAGAGVGALQIGGIVPTTPTLKFERIDPFKGFARLASRESAGHALRAGAAFLCALAAAAFALRAVLPVDASPLTVAYGAYGAALRAAFAVAALGALFGAFEFAAAFRARMKKLRMSFAEYKRELKEQDGDPLVRGRRRALHRSLSNGDVRRVREAAFVVCNPTHVAIALAYAPPLEPVPRVLVRAADDLALRVREIARESGVAIVENVALARALYAQARAGEPIPHDQYVAVAEIVVALTRAGALEA